MRAKQEGTETQCNSLKSQGNQFFSLGLFMQAAMMYSEALDLQPENTVLLNNRAMAYLKQGMADEAIADADRSLDLDRSNENIKAFWRRAQALLDLERYKEAELAADAGIAVQANNQHLARVRRKAREATAQRRLCGVDWVGQMENGVEKKFSFAKDGQMSMTVIGHSLQATYDLSVECTPQSMLVKMKPFPGSGSAPPPPVPYIYEFREQDEELWICHPVENNDLPTKFEGRGFTRLRRVEQAPEPSSSEPLEQRLARYMQEFNDILPLIPPQLPERPSEDEVSQEILLMDKVNKLKQRYGHEVHQKAMELARGEPAPAGAGLESLAEGLRLRLVARKVIQDSPKREAAENENAVAEAKAQEVQRSGLLAALGPLARKLCCR
ncbi:unnamed protein product [Effrenium voratum]|nr:unnamed protein product [Effrenium voratum]